MASFPALIAGEMNLHRNVSFYIATKGTGVRTTSTYNAANELLSSQQTVSSQFYQINCGGAAASPFQADAYYQVIDSNTGTFSHTIDLSGVVDPAPMSVYQSLRFDKFFYTLPNLTPGATYKVSLHFAECYFSSVGQRVFDVVLNGTTVLAGFDIVAAAGAANKAVIEEFTTIADGSGQINVSFRAITDLPQINGIEVLVGAGATSYGYDPNGNLLTTTDWTGITTYTWDSENRLLSMASSLNGTETYTYASDGKRRQKVTSAQTNSMIWDGANVLQERSVSNVRLTQYTDYPGYWGGLVSGRQGSTTSFYAFDSQGSARIVVSIGGTITDSYSYKVFGLELSQGNSSKAQHTNNPYLYMGQFTYYRDNISQLYVRARQLNTTQGRWISRDSLGFVGGDFNLYRYVENNAPNWIDPSGYICQLSNPWWCWSKPPCVDITNDYGASGRTGDQLAGCASCVSASICALIEYCWSPGAMLGAGVPILVPPFPLGGTLPTILGCAEVLGPVQCQNICMHNLWKQQSLPQWKVAQQICKPISEGGMGPSSFACCSAEVTAEQTGYTICAAQCGGGLSWLPQPRRIAFGKSLCCGDPNRDKQKPK